MIAYNHTILYIEAGKADSLAIKGIKSAVQSYSLTDGKFKVDLADYEAGLYYVQYYRGNEIIKEDELTVRQNLKYADSNFDPRSKARIILEAIQAHLAGTSTVTQRRLKCGEKEIQYSSFDELIKWKNFYQKEALKEEGKAPQVRHEKLYYRGI